MTTISYGQKNSDKNNQPESARVFISFIAETDGSITNVKIDKLKFKNWSEKLKKHRQWSDKSSKRNAKT